MDLDHFAADVESAVVDLAPPDEPLTLTSIHHPLDDPNFDPVVYINRVFPDKASLKDVAPALAALKADISSLDDKIVDTIRDQSRKQLHAREHLLAVETAMAELRRDVTEMHTQAETTTSVVKGVCDDIRKLHWAKENLAMSLVVLKKLGMLMSALTQLQSAAVSRDYTRCRDLLLAAKSLEADLGDLPNVDAEGMVAQAFIDVKQQILEDFDSIFDPDQDVHPHLHAACLCVDVISLDVRRDITTRFALQILDSYKQIFSSPAEFAKFDFVDRRFAWLRRAVKEYREHFEGKVFPAEWHVEARFVEHFCHVTRQHFVELLGSEVMTAEALMRVVRQTSDFESSLVATYTYEDGPEFRGLLLDCFDAYVGTIVKSEEAYLVSQLATCTTDTADTIHAQPGPSDDALPVSCYSSAIHIFHIINVSISKMKGVLSKARMVDVFVVYKRLLHRYSQVLSSRLERPTRETTFAVVNTCEFVDMTLDDMERAGRSLVVELTFEAEKHEFWQLKVAGVKKLLTEADSLLGPAKEMFAMMAWPEAESHLEPSGYVAKMCSSTSAFLIEIRKSLSLSVTYFTADRLVAQVVEFMSTAVSDDYIKRLHDGGREQLKTDLVALDSGLVAAVKAALPPDAIVPAGLKKYISRELAAVSSRLDLR